MNSQTKVPHGTPVRIIYPSFYGRVGRVNCMSPQPQMFDILVEMWDERYFCFDYDEIEVITEEEYQQVVIGYELTH